MQVTFVGYSCNNQGIFLHSIFLEYFFGIFPGISLGIFSEYTGTISWECSTNIPQIDICPVNLQKQFYQLKEDKIRDKPNENTENFTIRPVRTLFGLHLFLNLQ